MDRSDLAERMKTYYEQIPKTKLMRRCPVVIRLDGKSFHTFTRGFKKPFDEILIKSMQETMKYLCENIQGCVLGYTQSDEISLLLIDYKKLTSEAWFDYEVQKMCSVAASMATMAFNEIFQRIYAKMYMEANDKDKEILLKTYGNKCFKAMFDARVFNIPKEEVTNYFYWRQLDCIRNSILMVGQANFSYKELHNKTCKMVQDMLITQKEINWNDYPTHQKRGSCCVKTGANETRGTERPHWIIDTEIPQFKDEGRNYIDKLVYITEED